MIDPPPPRLLYTASDCTRMPKDRSPYREVSDLVVRRLVLEGWVSRVVLVLVGCADQLANMDQAECFELWDGSYVHWAMALAAELTP